MVVVVVVCIVNSSNNKMLNTIRSAQLHGSRGRIVVCNMYSARAHTHTRTTLQPVSDDWLRVSHKKKKKIRECNAWGRQRFSTLVRPLSELQCGTCSMISLCARSCAFLCSFTRLLFWFIDTRELCSCRMHTRSTHSTELSLRRTPSHSYFYTYVY